VDNESLCEIAKDKKFGEHPELRSKFVRRVYFNYPATGNSSIFALKVSAGMLRNVLCCFGGGF
jgi:hypothetical protein